ncbi:3-phosphoshikimate 1-carboxyvinyltransferase [Hanamia caeni]|uniref:3-phosphoshikimate 1-carboxyvinyltransferase n=1 Tax=Hanamia caeni TaxID=2294116 RepID=A0A3M9NJH1_9BACT|nr:3-phosphoshikimate 1-carboxyvinyltransferase [Hanamia caeni]RNI37904.1 3-phosphoshikimate 1-carboxyvinyltransferase [Hanamia caeni]
MNVSIHPSPVSGNLKAPPSKSSMQRACAAALITPGTTVIDNFGNSNDEKAALDIIARLGATVNKLTNELVIASNDFIFHSPVAEKKNVILNVGESGLSMRMFAPIAGLFNFDIVFTGEGSILKRPMNFFDEILPLLDVEVHSNNGMLPVTLRGPLQPKNITVDGSLSSQFLTGLLFAFAKACTAPVSITVKNLSSRPYIDLTVSVLKHFGFHIENNNYEVFTISPRKDSPSTTVRYTVEGDWSNAAFLLVAGATAGELTLSGVDMNSSQGDKDIMKALYDSGAEVVLKNDEIFVKRKKLTAFQFDATHCPDLFPPLVALASYCNGNTSIKGVSRLLHKESNRAIALRDEFKKMNVEIELNGDVMIVHGGGVVKGAEVSSHNDHRIAMATAVAGLSAKGITNISGSEAVKKSYPDFYRDIASIQKAHAGNQ